MGSSYEGQQPRRGSDAKDKSQDEFAVIVKGCATQSDVAAQLNADWPAFNAGLQRTTYDYEELYAGTWRAKIKYVSKDHPERKENNNQATQPAAPVRLGTPGKWSRSCQLSSARVNVSLDTAVYPVDAPSHNGLIEVDGEGAAKGVDRLAMAKEWVFEKCVSYANFTTSFLDGIDACDLTLNSSAFFWMPTKASLFLGMTTTPEEESVRCVCRFAVGKNETGLTIAGISGIDKNAHDYLWAFYNREPDGQRLCSKVKAIYVEELYPAESWSALTTFVGVDAVGGPS